MLKTNIIIMNYAYISVFAFLSIVFTSCKMQRSKVQQDVVNSYSLKYTATCREVYKSGEILQDKLNYGYNIKILRKDQLPLEEVDYTEISQVLHSMLNQPVTVFEGLLGDCNPELATYNKNMNSYAVGISVNDKIVPWSLNVRNDTVRLVSRVITGSVY